MIKTMTALAALGMIAGTALAGPFGQGNLVVIRVGDGTTALSSASFSTFLDEYTPGGSLVQSIPMPTALSGANKRFTTSGNSTSEGQLALSRDGRYLTLGGYDAAPGTASIGTTSTTAVLRVMARVGLDGVVDTSTSTTAFSGNQIRGVISDDGSQFWAAGGNNGIQFASFGGSSSFQINGTGSTNNRNVNISGGQLYISSGSATNRGVNTVGTGLPTTNGQVMTLLPGTASVTGSSPYDFFFVGSDLLYIADDSQSAGVGGIQKWQLQSGVWTRIATFQPNGRLRQMTSTTNAAGQVVIYCTVVDSSNIPSIQSLVDVGTPTFTTVATGATNTLFRGIEFAPVPAPGALALLGLGGLVAGRRRR